MSTQGIWEREDISWDEKMQLHNEIVEQEAKIREERQKIEEAQRQATLAIDREKTEKERVLKAELEAVKHDIEQVDLFGMVRDDVAQKRARAAEIVNELRVMEGKKARKLK